MASSPKSTLLIAYSLLPVSDESCGGAEQILATLERELSRRGTPTAVAACEGSRVAGELLPTGAPASRTDAFDQRNAEHTRQVLQYCAERDFRVVHDHSGSFWPHAGAVKAPVLATLHLPRGFYREEMFSAIPPNVFFNCVSDSQVSRFADIPRVVGVVRNGIAVDRFPFSRSKNDYLLWLGRICPEKAPHIAIEVAQRAGLPLILAGQVYPFSYHQQYFEREVRPHLQASNAAVTFVETPSFAQKLELLRDARALLVTSLAAETSSLVSLEAQACGTPVIAFKHGALGEVVRSGSTGFVVDTLNEMVSAVADLHHLSPSDCREWVATNFSAATMADSYEALYERLIAENAEARKVAA